MEQSDETTAPPEMSCCLFLKMQKFDQIAQPKLGMYDMKGKSFFFCQLRFYSFQCTLNGFTAVSYIAEKNSDAITQ